MGTQAAATGVALLFLGLHMQKYVELNDYLEEALSGMALIAPNTTLLPLIFSPQGAAPGGRLLSTRIAPFAHLSGHIAAQRGIVDLSNYEATLGGFPVKFRTYLNPNAHIWFNFRFRSPQVDFLSYSERTGGRVDYVLIWRTAKTAGENPLVRFYQHLMPSLFRDFQDHPVTEFNRRLEPSIHRQLAQGYELLYTSPRGFMQLYRRKEKEL